VRVVQVSQVLKDLANPQVLPDLTALRPDQSLYKLIAYQPTGTLEITDKAIRRLHAERTDREVRNFLDKAIQSDAAIVIAPEYSVPWDTLISVLREGKRPEVGALWVLGCESLALSEVGEIGRRLEGVASVISEDIDLAKKGTYEYLNPVAYVFQSRDTTGESHGIQVLLQFKTFPSGDKDNVEARGMFPGSIVYMFHSPQHIKLLTLICSDAFSFSEELIKEHGDDLLLLHIQLNNKPYDKEYKRYRGDLFKYGHQAEVFSLNWASGTGYVEPGKEEKPLVEFNCSAWYRRVDERSLTEERIRHNDLRGLYFTYDRDLRIAAMHLTNQSCVVIIQTTKVFHRGLYGALSYLNGPDVEEISIWSDITGSWDLIDRIDDGFAAKLAKLDCETNDLDRAHEAAPIDVDRIAALSTGRIDREDWYRPLQLESLALGGDDIVQRMTLDLDKRSLCFKEDRLKAVQIISQLRREEFPWPSEVGFLKSGYEIAWREGQPQRNVAVVSPDGKRTYATLVYVHVADKALLEKRDLQVRQAVAGRAPYPPVDQSPQERREYERAHYERAPNVCILYLNGITVSPLLGTRNTDISRPSHDGLPSISDASYKGN
jgi:hypothetical protein